MNARDATPLIRLDNVSRRFHGADRRGGLPAVDRVSLSIAAGERFGIIGSSSAGKSTLLRLINLLEVPDTGRVIVDGRDLTRLSRPALREARAGIGMIFAQFDLLQNATVHDNVAFPLAIRQPRLSGGDRQRRVDECLEVVGLTGKRDAYPAQLSGGQKQRVAIARVLATRPAVMLCDEPTSALDAETTRAVLDVLADINDRFGVTLVVVTQELAVARRLCDRVAVMSDGRIVEDLVLAEAGDRLETAIARAGGVARAPDGGPRPAAHRRAGGLPLPSTRAIRGSAVPIAARVRAAASPWTGRLVFAARRSAGVPVARRAGGLPLPAPYVPVDPAPAVSRDRPSRDTTACDRERARHEEAVHV